MSEKSSAQLLLEKANKKANSSAGWFSSGSKFEEAGDLYQHAANAFKLEKRFLEAGDAFAREAECREECEEKSEAANAWWNASKAYKRGRPDLAVAALSQTVDLLSKLGRFRQAADREKEIGQIYLQEPTGKAENMRKACEKFERAGNWYADEDATATANACFKDAADLHAELDEYPQAIVLYEGVANHSLASPLTKYSVKEYWLRSGLCALALGDTVTGKMKMEKYSSQDPGFSLTREAKFVQILIEAVDAGDEEAFTAAVVEFDQVTKLDNWKTTILLKIKKSIQEEGGLT